MKSIKKLEDCVSFSDVLKFHAQNEPDRICLHDGITGIDYSFKEIDGLVDRAAFYLMERGCSYRDIMSVVLDNCFEYIILFFAALRIGAIFNPFPANLSSDDIRKYLNYVKPKLVFCQGTHMDILNSKDYMAELISKKSAKRDTLDQKNPDGDSLLEKLKAYTSFKETDFCPEGSDAACIYYSSGTTDNPKGIIYTHRNMISNISSLVRGFAWSENDTHLILLPLGHTAAINYSFLPCVYCKGKIILFESFWKVRSKIWRCVEEFGVTYMEVVPSVLFSILSTPYKDYKRERLANFKYIGCGSAPLPLEVQKKVQEKFDIKVASLYGLSETGPTHIDDPLKKDWRPGSIGRPLDVNKVKILNQDGSEASVDDVGEIAIKGENVFAGYLKNKKAYDQAFQGEYFLTGDLGYKDSKGLFYFAERKKDLIIKGGVNIFPGEIDEVIFEHSQVKEALTVGVDDQYLGQRIKSFVVMRKKSSLNQEDLRQFCLEKLGAFKCPDEFAFIEDIPKGPSGKLLRRAVKSND